MNILAFDTSTEYLSLALQKGDEVFNFVYNAGQTHSQIILPQIQILLEAAGLQLSDLNGIAFGAGPGSFTGVRIAAGVAQGLALGSYLPVVGVCTLLALAEEANADSVIACLDARMGEVYHAAYKKVAGEWQCVADPGLYKPEATPALEGTASIGAGSGWQTYLPQLSAVYDGQLQAVQPQILPAATAILRLAHPKFARGEASVASEAMPIYIRNRVALKTLERQQGVAL